MKLIDIDWYWFSMLYFLFINIIYHKHNIYIYSFPLTWSYSKVLRSLGCVSSRCKCGSKSLAPEWMKGLLKMDILWHGHFPWSNNVKDMCIYLYIYISIYIGFYIYIWFLYIHVYLYIYTHTCTHRVSHKLALNPRKKKKNLRLQAGRVPLAYLGANGCAAAQGWPMTSIWISQGLPSGND